MKTKYIFKISQSFIVLFVSFCIWPTEKSLANPLDRYVSKPDPAYEYRLISSKKKSGYTTFILEMTSQSYLTKKDVDRTLWKHWVTIVKPTRVRHQTGMLMITGGSNGKEPPLKANDIVIQTAVKTGSVVTELNMVPNQPLRFVGEDRDRYEDAFIAYTWDKYLRTGEERWPARLPMTKAAVRAMDTITNFLLKPERGKAVLVNKFVVAGASKRGWTTWSVAAVDKRVVAIVPIVIDMLNVVPSFKHHYRAYGGYSPAVKDYVDMGIMGWQDMPEYKKLLKFIEPYEFRERFTMPKFLINACGDQFFLPDSWKFYYRDLVGQKHLRYVPNTGHSLNGTDAVYSMASYFNAILNETKLPDYDWNILADGSIKVTTLNRPKEVLLWQCTNTEARDFRIEVTGKTWVSRQLRSDGKGSYLAKVSEPPKGWTAFMVELTFPEIEKRSKKTKLGERLGKSNNQIGVPLKFTTGVHVVPETMPYEFKQVPIPER
jgi:PhoPQ-activated pathogenicity-related protein